MEAGRKVLYLQVASDDEVYQGALVISFHLILSVMSLLFVFYLMTHSLSPPEVPRRVYSPPFFCHFSQFILNQ